MSILSIIALVFAVVLLALVSFDVIVKQKTINIFLLLIVIILIINGSVELKHLL